MNGPDPAQVPEPAAPRAPNIRAQTRLALAPRPGAVPCARLHAKQVLWEWGLAELGDAVELALAELVTNAVTHGSRDGEGQQRPVIFRLSARDPGVRIEVWDISPQLPRTAPGLRIRSWPISGRRAIRRPLGQFPLPGRRQGRLRRHFHAMRKDAR